MASRACDVRDDGEDEVPAHLGPFMAVAALLLVAGSTKIARPHGAQRALRRAGMVVPAGAIRAAGGVEAAAGIAAISAGTRPAALAVAAVYALLGAVAWRLRRRGAECGCFGDDAAPVTGLHLVVNAAGASLALAAAVRPPGGVGAIFSAPTAGGLVTGALAVLVAAQLRLVLTRLASVSSPAAAGRR